MGPGYGPDVTPALPATPLPDNAPAAVPTGASS